ncbi:hypothetical protein HPB52_007205 [Rhipicephalus sanguineus]|uniref:SAM domain-containing protein n=1 Tax=Rhipicephalus sanguineus TaxID=34632 RepID=A0A9D4QCR6_RHISA|nr:hypothetical protein HPB52_007205 [Rhipicephalus sanguineus]
MASLNGDAAPPSGIATSIASVPNDTYPIDVRDCTYRYQGTFVQTTTLLGVYTGVPQPFVRIPYELTVIPSPPSVEVSGAPQIPLVVRPGYYAVSSTSEPLQLTTVLEPVLSIPTVPCLYQVVSLTFVAGHDQSQAPTAVGQPWLAAPVQPNTGASIMTAVTMPVPPVLPLPVPADAAGLVPQMPVMTQQGMSDPRARRFPHLHSQMTVDDVASYIGQLPGCDCYAETFRRHQIDGKALLLLQEHHLTSQMKIGLGPALKIVAAINWLRRQEKKKSVRPPQ